MLAGRGNPIPQKPKMPMCKKTSNAYDVDQREAKEQGGPSKEHRKKSPVCRNWAGELSPQLATIDESWRIRRKGRIF